MFAGAEDLICNHVGIERMIANLEWNGETGFGNATDEEWHVDGRQAGTWTTARNMTYVKINDASHMVPYDQPIAAHDMFLRFIGASLLSAAGPAAQVPSRIGNEIPAVLGSTHPNGTALGSAASSASELDAARLDVLAGGEDAAGAGGKSSLLHGDAALEGLVNASSALVLVALMGAAFGLFLCFRRRSGGRLSRAPGGEGWGALGGATGAARKHERVTSLGRGVRVTDEESDGREEGAHELDELMSRRAGGAGTGKAAGYRDEATEDEEGPFGGSGAKATRAPLGRRDEEEKVFGLGDDDDEGSDEGGLPRSRRVD
ncbi:hypothetical protein JCM3770_006697 [Rhodotorula araucariae]